MSGSLFYLTCPCSLSRRVSPPDAYFADIEKSGASASAKHKRLSPSSRCLPQRCLRWVYDLMVGAASLALHTDYAAFLPLERMCQFRV